MPGPVEHHSAVELFLRRANLEHVEAAIAQVHRRAAGESAD